MHRPCRRLQCTSSVVVLVRFWFGQFFVIVIVIVIVIVVVSSNGAPKQIVHFRILIDRKFDIIKSKSKRENNTWDSNVVPHRSTNQARTCLTSLSRREAVLSCWYGRSRNYHQTQSLQSHILLPTTLLLHPLLLLYTSTKKHYNTSFYSLVALQ